MTKTTKPMIRIHNAETGEIIDREMDADQFAQYEADQAANILAQAELQSKANQRQLILDKLGLTADEAQLLIG